MFDSIDGFSAAEDGGFARRRLCGRALLATDNSEKKQQNPEPLAPACPDSAVSRSFYLSSSPAFLPKTIQSPIAPTIMPIRENGK